MAEPLVSVFLPAYNQIDYIDEAIGSAVEQDYDNLEVICGDDGSIDGTPDRMLEWAARYPGRVIPVLGPHVGITGNCNRIFRHLRGKYVIQHAGDDIFLPGKIRKQVDWFEEDERRVMCGHAVEAFDSATGKPLYKTTDYRPLVTGKGAERYLDEFGLFPDISIAGRRSAYPANGYDERTGSVSVFKLNIDILAGGGEYGYVEGVLARTRVHPASITQRSRVEPGMHLDFLEGYLTSLAITEASYPHLLASCRKSRGRLLYNEGRWLQARRNYVSARRYFAAAAWENPALAWKAAAAYGLSCLPDSVSDRIDKRSAAKK